VRVTDRDRKHAAFVKAQEMTPAQQEIWRTLAFVVLEDMSEDRSEPHLAGIFSTQEKADAEVARLLAHDAEIGWTGKYVVKAVPVDRHANPLA
jgi:hypothetical protein